MLFRRVSISRDFAGNMLTEDQYRALCKACDRVLLAEDSCLDRVAIDWLHVIREHPSLLCRYETVFEKQRTLVETVRVLMRNSRKWLAFINQMVRSIRSDGKEWYGSDDLPQTVDVLFISHLLNDKQAGLSHDFYFGNVPNELIRAGYSSVIALINQSGGSSSELAKKWKEPVAQRLIFSNSLKPGNEMHLRRRAGYQSGLLRKLSKKEQSRFYQSILSAASKEALSSLTLFNLRLAEQIRILVGRLKPKVLIVTHEGHAWERVTFSAARSAHPAIRCIGYQHAAVFKRQHALVRNLATQYNPDQILSAGQAGKRQLEQMPGLAGIPIGILGSNRGSGTNSTDEKVPDNDMLESKIREQTCLVLPEGFISECEILLGFSLKCALLCPDTRFIWRLHPILSQKEIQSRITLLQNLPSNITFSTSSMEEDLDRSRWVLYRGTTAIIQAVIAGLKPVYLRIPDEMTIDPLYEMEKHIDRVDTEHDFKNLLASDDGIREHRTASRSTTVRDYCMKYYSPYDARQLIACLREE
jgi:hypothetical protein